MPRLELVRSHYLELRRLLPNHRLSVESMKEAYAQFERIAEIHKAEFEQEIAHGHHYDVAHWLLVDHVVHALKNHPELGLAGDEERLKRVARLLGRDFSEPTALQAEDQLHALDEMQQDPKGSEILRKISEEYEHLTLAAGLFAQKIPEGYLGRKDMFTTPMAEGIMTAHPDVLKSMLEHKLKLAKEREKTERN